MNVNTIIRRSRIEISVFGVFFLMLLLFIIVNPRVFLTYNIYKAVFTILPLTLILSVSSVFVVASGGTDLSFPSTIGVGAWLFTYTTVATGNPYLGLGVALVIGAIIGLINGLLVTRLELSPLVATLGMNFLLRGLIMIGTNGEGESVVFLNETVFYKLLVGQIANFPVQMLWGIAIVVVLWFIFNRHTLGAHICYVGDNSMSARQTGVKVAAVKTMAFVILGVCAGFCGVLATLINGTFWPTSGDSYLLVVLAAVFLGGTPTWGGVGTIVGAAIGAMIMSFLETGIIVCGFTGFYTQFFFGLILIISLISHRFSGFKRVN